LELHHCQLTGKTAGCAVLFLKEDYGLCLGYKHLQHSAKGAQSLLLVDVPSSVIISIVFWVVL
jgi:hypothetical protein